MSPDEEALPGDPGKDISEDELKRILGDDYQAVVKQNGEAGDPSAPAGTAQSAPAPPAGGPAPASGRKTTPSPTPAPPSAAPPEAAGSNNMSDEEAEAWARQMEAEMAQSQPAPSGAEAPLPEPVQPVRLAQLEDRGSAPSGGIDLLLDVKLPISVELGRSEMLVKDILDCGPGTVIELTKLAGEPVDIFVNGRMIAQGEVVVVDEHFGVRVTNLISPRERVKSLA